VGLVESRQRRACPGLARLECRATRGQRLVQLRRIGRKVRRQRDAVRLARGGRRVELAQVLLRSDRDQERLSGRVRQAVLLDHGRRHAERRRARRQQVDAAAEHRAGLCHAIEPWQQVGRAGAEPREGVEFLALDRERLEFGHHRFGRAGPGVQGGECGVGRLGHRVFGVDAPQQRGRPPRRISACQRLVAVEHDAQLLQRQLRARLAVGLQLHRARAREAVERGGELLARGEQLEPLRGGWTQRHGVPPSATRCVIPPRSSSWSRASSPR
jgi:hypothetical protein